jgi:hypothetical protein
MHDDPTGNDGQHRGVPDADEDQALDALDQAWGDTYDEFWVTRGEWGAHRKGAPDDQVVTAATPDELDTALRADRVRRER